jgi:cysteine desulfuration protein SufE
MTARERAQMIVDQMNLLPDAQERFLRVISWGKKGAGLPEEKKTDDYRIEGCQSMLWMVPEFRDGRCYFECDSDAFITKGVSSILCHVYNDSTPQEVVELPLDFMTEAGITQHLSPNRSNGLAQIGRKIREFAAAHLPPA